MNNAGIIPGYATGEFDRFDDARGHFVTPWDRDLHAGDAALAPHSTNFSVNPLRGTLRGLHYQVAPCTQRKRVFCLQGEFQDVVADLRHESPAYLTWTTQVLSASGRKFVEVPAGCAHGFVTLQPDTIVGYLIDGQFSPAHARAVRWNDPAFRIEWVATPAVMSDKDRGLPDFQP